MHIYVYIYVCVCYGFFEVRFERNLMFACVFGSFPFVAVPVRTASDQSYRLQKFKLRLFYASDIRQPNLEVIVKCTVWFEKYVGNVREL